MLPNCQVLLSLKISLIFGIDFLRKFNVTKSVSVYWFNLNIEIEKDEIPQFGRLNMRSMRNFNPLTNCREECVKLAMRNFNPLTNCREECVKLANYYGHFLYNFCFAPLIFFQIIGDILSRNSVKYL